MKHKKLMLLVAVNYMAACGDHHKPGGSSDLAQTRSASSVPDADATCPDVIKALKVPANSNGVEFDKDCKTAYILPPTKGDVSLAAVAGSKNLQFCSAMSEVGETSEITLSSASVLAGQIKAAIEANSDLESQVKASALERAEAKADYDVQNNQLTEAKAEKEKLETRAKDAQTLLVLCLSKGGECADEKKAVQATLEAVVTFEQQQIKPLQEKVQVAEKSYKAKDNKHKALTTEVTEFLLPLFTLQDKLFGLQEKVAEIYAEYAQIEGAKAQLIYTLPWDKLLQEFQEMNPDILFSRLRAVNGQIYATTKLKAENGEVDSTLPSLLWATIPGLDKPVGPAFLPEGDKKVDIAPGDSQPKTNVDIEGLSGKNGISGVPHSVSAQIGLSLTGACPYVTKEDQTLDKVTAKDFAAHMVVNATVEYEVAAERSYKAEYHLGNMARVIQKQTKRKRFFSSKVTNELEKTGSSTDWFKITFNCTSGAHCPNAEEKEKITQQTKAELIERAVKNFAQLNGLQIKPPALPGLEANAIGTAGSPLNGACKTLNCGAVGFVFKLLGSLGNTSAVSNFIEQNDAWATQEVQDRTVLQRQAFVSFSPKDVKDVE